MHICIEDTMNELNRSGESFINEKTSTIGTVHDDLEHAVSSFENLPADTTDEDACAAFGWNWEYPKFLNFLRHGEQYLRLSDQYDVHESRIMEDFICTVDNDGQRETLWMAIRGSGASRRFKDTVHRYGIQGEWYEFKETRLLEIAKEWCRENGVEWAYQSPEKILRRRKFETLDLEDAPAEPGDLIFQNGIFEFNISRILADMRNEPWEFDLEEVELDLDIWSCLYNCEDDGEGAEEPEGVPLLLEISPDRRILHPDDRLALSSCCNLIDGPRWLKTAKRAGKKTLTARLIPMECHERYICGGRRQYTEYWNGKCDDLIGDAGRIHKP